MAWLSKVDNSKILEASLLYQIKIFGLKQPNWPPWLFKKKEKSTDGEIRKPYVSSIGNWSQALYYRRYGFDYAFTVRKENESDFMIGWLSDGVNRSTLNRKVHRRNSKPIWTFGAVHYKNGKYDSKEFPLRTQAEEVFVLPAKFGYAIILEHLRDEKRVRMSLKEVF